MQKSKILEKEVDKRAAEILNGFKQDVENQPDLFGES
jgi:hypothetical protein